MPIDLAGLDPDDRAGLDPDDLAGLDPDDLAGLAARVRGWLASRRTRAEPRGDGTWLVNGQRVRSSYSGRADFGLPRDRDPYADQPFEERPHD